MLSDYGQAMIGVLAKSEGPGAEEKLIINQVLKGSVVEKSDAQINAFVEAGSLDGAAETGENEEVEEESDDPEEVVPQDRS